MKYLNSKVVVKSSKNKGPKVIIFSGIHGDEVSGVKALDELVPKLKIIKGEVYFVYSNLEAIKRDKRFVEYNLNRCFLDKQTKTMKSTLEGRTAKQLLKILKHCDYSLDLHSSKSSKNKPYLICEKNCLDFLDCFPTKIVLLGTSKTHPGATDGYMFSKNKIGFCVESGLHKSKSSINIAKKSVTNFLKKLKMIKGEGEFFGKEKVYQAEFMYKNKSSQFKLARKFSDFEKMNKKTLIGLDGSKKIYLKKNEVILFPSNTKKIGGECFVRCREIKNI